MVAPLARVLLPAIWMAPLGLACLVAGRRGQQVMVLLAPAAALPALLACLLLSPGTELNLPWLLLGGRLGIDATGRLFLFFTGLLYFAAAWFSRHDLAGDRRRARFFFFLLLAMAGNCGLTVALDLITFNFFFALMSFSAYGLVIHYGRPEDLAAGRLYLLLVVIGESLLLAGLLLLAAGTRTLALPAMGGVAPAGFWVFALLLAGFGIKAGLPGVHVWLPLAHPAAPVPASAVLSGAMIEAGLLGWLRFLPLGQAAFPGWSAFCLVMGFFAAFFGVAVGLTQDKPKTVLAYSSISQMGLMAAALGVGLAAPAHWPEALRAVTLYAVHHGLAKGALFLGVGAALRAEERPLVRTIRRLGLALPALALAGAPFTSGAAAKTGLLKAAAHLPFPWPGWLAALLPLSAAATGLLMLHFLSLARPQAHERRPLTGGLLHSWLLLVVASLAATWLLPSLRPSAVQTLGLAKTVGASWPLLLAIGLAFLLRSWRLGAHLRLPAGDVLVFYARAGRFLRNLAAAGLDRLEFPLPRGIPAADIRRLLQRAERTLGDWLVVGLLCAFLMLLFFILQVAC